MAVPGMGLLHRVHCAKNEDLVCVVKVEVCRSAIACPSSRRVGNCPRHSWSWLLFRPATDCVAKVQPMTGGKFVACKHLTVPSRVQCLYAGVPTAAGAGVVLQMLLCVQGTPALVEL